MRIDRLKVFEFLIENVETITAPHYFLRYVKILLEKSGDDIDQEFMHTRQHMAELMRIHNRTLASYEQGWAANCWIEQTNPKAGNPATRKLGSKFDIFRKKNEFIRT